MFSFFKRREERKTAPVAEGNSPVPEPVRPHPYQSRAVPAPIAIRRRPSNNYRQLVPERVQKLIAGLLIWAFLAAWSISAFWEHIDTLEPADKWMAKFGACGAEIILLFFILWKIYNKHLRVRFFALLFSAALGITILVHAGALRSIKGAKAEQIDREYRFAENAARIAEGSTRGAIEGVGSALQKAGASARARNGQIAAAQRRGQEGVKSAQKSLKEMADQTDLRMQNATWLPAWYIEKHTYTGVFVIALTLFSILLGIWMTAGDDDVDENYDGIPDHQQPHLFSPYANPYQLPPTPIQYQLLSTPPPYFHGQAQRDGRSSVSPGPVPPAPMSTEDRSRAAQGGQVYAVYPQDYQEGIDMPGNHRGGTQVFRNGAAVPPHEDERGN